MVERLELLLKKKDLSPAQLADEIGVQRSGIYHIMKGRNKPGMDFLTKLLNHFPELNPGWLILGRGPMILEKGLPVVEEPGVSSPQKLRPDSKRTDNDYRQLNKEEKKEKSKEINKAEGQKRIERIVVFFEDQTFKEYLPKE